VTVIDTATAAPVDTRPYIAFTGTVSRVVQLSPSLIRLTCTGPEFDHFGPSRYDQRIKLILPVPGRGFVDFPTGADWHEEWRQLPPDRQNPIRTYTVRAFRPDTAELDLDLVLHGINGPASAWAAGVQVGDPVAVLGPNRRYSGDPGGVEFVPPPAGTPMLLAGDETALPAIAAILEQVPRDVRGKAIIEVPYPGDRIELIKPAGVSVEWLVRDGRPTGQPMLDCFADHAAELFGDRTGAAPGQSIEDLHPEIEPWDVPEQGSYAWIAGEAAMVRALRRLLVTDLGVPKSSVAFMGYWRR
jgi:NADPH-dependent ferric siderophore reductase